jgi:TRAP-type C4-dicarboxylate transport system permease small subunit
MRSHNLIVFLAKCIDAIIRAFSKIAFVGVCFTCLVVLLNVAGRYFFKSPFMGTIEIVELGMVIIVSFAVPFTALQGRHIRVDLLVSHLPKRLQGGVLTLGLLLSASIFGLVTYQCIVVALSYFVKTGEVTNVLSIPYVPFRFMLAVGMFLLTLELLKQAIDTVSNQEVRRDVKKDD